MQKLLWISYWTIVIVISYLLSYYRMKMSGIIWSIIHTTFTLLFIGIGIYIKLNFAPKDK